MERFDVVVLGGGPGGHAAALEAADAGGRVAVVEAEHLGGQCVHATCIPSTIISGAVRTFIDIQELATVGITAAVDTFDLGRAEARRVALVRQLQHGIVASLKGAKVEVLAGRGVIDGSTVIVGGDRIGWDQLVVATGSRWEPPAIAGVPAARVVTPDAVHHLDLVPRRVTVIAGGTARTAFSLESAIVLAISGASVRVVAPGVRLLPWLDEITDAFARQELEMFGIDVALGWSAGTDPDLADADLVVAPDERTPFVDGLGLDTIGLQTGPGRALVVDRRGCTTHPQVFAAGDVTGGVFLTQAATLLGRAAGASAVGRTGPAVTDIFPHALHLPEMAWVGLGAEEAAGAGWDVVTGLVDLSTTAASVAAGGRTGVVTLVADRELGGILGVQAVGAGAEEIVGFAAAAMQSELTVSDVGSWALWHPSAGEALVDAARLAEREIGAG